MMNLWCCVHLHLPKPQHSKTPSTIGACTLHAFLQVHGSRCLRETCRFAPLPMLANGWLVIALCMQDQIVFTLIWLMMTRVTYPVHAWVLTTHVLLLDIVLQAANVLIVMVRLRAMVLSIRLFTFMAAPHDHHMLVFLTPFHAISPHVLSSC